mgnify:CR=1 FL=1
MLLGTADINRDGTVDLKLRTHLSNLGGAERAASAAADKLEPVVPHYLDITQKYANRSITPAQGTVSNFLGDFWENFHIFVFLGWTKVLHLGWTGWR